MRKKHEVFDYSLRRCELFESRFPFTYYQLISEPSIQNSFKGKSDEMSVLCSRKKLTFMVVQYGLWFLNLWLEGQGKDSGFILEMRKGSYKVDFKLFLRGILVEMVTVVCSCL